MKALGSIDEQPLCKPCGISVAIEIGDNVLELTWRAKGNGAGLIEHPVRTVEFAPVDGAAIGSDVEVITVRNASPSAQAVKSREEKTMPKPKASCVKCGKGLRADSPGYKFELCAKCHKNAVGEETTAASAVVERKKPGRKPGWTPKPKSIAAPDGGAELGSPNLTLTLSVAPEWLDKAFGRFTVGQKLAAIAHVLQS
ncbi:hypothetical protein [Candidatus Korobacter versatilis]|uniref:hypothetical protein n=1 Tax=Candidatus Korobacter versatilis TaxID=658062 RepID=UPI0002F06B48|nr:hypothetical protein [Candidatus Koribacter versatilis]